MWTARDNCLQVESLPEREKGTQYPTYAERIGCDIEHRLTIIKDRSVVLRTAFFVMKDGSSVL